MTSYDQFFREATQHTPHPYQRRVAASLFARRNIVLRAPTGAGKTLSVLAPFLFDRDRIGVSKLIYCLPLRALATGIYKDARKLAASSLRVTLQTGENPGDPFFALGDIIITTYDQLLSGLLCSPYGLPTKLNNINAAAIFGALVVFDEFHLMDPDQAFLTAIHCLKTFQGHCLSAWMTATATSPLLDELSTQLHTEEIHLTSEELVSLYEDRSISRVLRLESSPLTADLILQHACGRTLVVVNQVKTAQNLYHDLTLLAPPEGFPPERIELLHARFFSSDRLRKQGLISDYLGKGKFEKSIVIATQVVEAGLDLSSDHLFTELCPMNSLVQRAGRCARFPGESGQVHVHPILNTPLPYDKASLDRTSALLEPGAQLSPATVSAWVNQAHAEEDLVLLRLHRGKRPQQCLDRIRDGITKKDCSVSELIRAGQNTIRLIISAEPFGRSYSTFEAIPVYRTSVKSLLKQSPALRYDPEAQNFWSPLATDDDLDKAFVVCVPPSVARYTSQLGLQLGSPGDCTSPPREAPKPPGYAPLRRESWLDHSRAVADQVRQRITREVSSEVYPPQLAASLMAAAAHAALLHDLGKLQLPWYQWANAYESAKDSSFHPGTPLAHTSFDYSSQEDRLLSSSTRPQKPNHAAASAFYASAFLPSDAPHRECVLAAILSHHGGWFPPTLTIHALIPQAQDQCKHFGFAAHRPLRPPAPSDLKRLRHPIEEIFADQFEQLWSVAAYLMRVLRLSDQKATEESSTDA
ncbi:MAG: CRISPR-associated helicase Cas3' [Bryobacterales bacterium]|nr:CRISPR-associated helicase Cas3' [Bryobacterales bacterium]